MWGLLWTATAVGQKQRGLKRTQGHREGARVFRRICEYANDIGIRYITFYAFSTENWARPPEEVSAIMELLREYLFEAEERKKENAARGMRIRFIGSQEGLPGDIISLMNQAQKESLAATKTIVNIAVNYGGRQEILQSVQRLAQQAAVGENQAGGDYAGTNRRRSVYGWAAGPGFDYPPERGIPAF